VVDREHQGDFVDDNLHLLIPVFARPVGPLEYETEQGDIIDCENCEHRLVDKVH